MFGNPILEAITLWPWLIYRTFMCWAFDSHDWEYSTADSGQVTRTCPCGTGEQLVPDYSRFVEFPFATSAVRGGPRGIYHARWERI